MTEGKLPGKGTTDLAEGLPTQRLAQEARSFLEAFAEKALASVGERASEKLSEATRGLIEKAEGEDGGGPGVKAAITGVKALTEGKGPFRAALGAGATGLKEKVKQLFRGGGGGKKKLKLTNIVETIDVGVPIRLAYNQWTQFEDFPTFTKKVEQAERPSEEKVNWKAQVWWSHRNWESTVLEQVPDDHIVWRSKGAKGHVDGAVSFSELAPNLTRICLVLEYHPQGFFEHTGNLWRAQGRRARLEFKHFQRHVMAHAILEPDEIEGWRGEIRDGEVVKTHEEALDDEGRAGEGESRAAQGEEPRGEEQPEEALEGEHIGAEEEEEEEEEHEGERPAAEENGEQSRSEEEPDEQGTGTEEEPEEPRRARRLAGGEDEERPQRPTRRRPSGEDEERSQRAVRRRPAADVEERPARARRPTRRGSPPTA